MSSTPPPGICYIVPELLGPRRIRLAYTFEHDTAKTLPALAEMQRQMLTSQPQLHPLLDIFVKKMGDFYLHFDPLVADSITASLFSFIFTCNLEPRLDYRAMPLRPGALNWANFVRMRNGIGEPLAWMTFLKEENPDIVEFMQAIPDMANFFNYVNDVLLFV